ncbi:hypothetical protein FRC02_004532 [Tulasnella sp. 418]|nr:hypothetical protein FRC02_004532 [Tulasnella sp. 418]
MRVGALSRELYIAGIPSEARIDDIKKFLEVYGPVSSIRLKPGFAFAHFEKDKDAADFMADFHGREVLGATLVVQYALPNTEKNQYQSSPSLYFTRSPDHRVIVTGLSKLVGWQVSRRSF